MTDPVIHDVDPARLAPGGWSHEKNKRLGEGDIAASYSADRIGMGEPVRKPFIWCNQMWVNVGTAMGPDRCSVKAYRLVSVDHYEGEPVTYYQKTADCETARHDPNGFYHGMQVQRGGKDYVLVGSPVIFRSGFTQQLNLFGPS